jgi:hypothetical protein
MLESQEVHAWTELSTDRAYRAMLREKHPHRNWRNAAAPYSWWAHAERNPATHSRWLNPESKEYSQ